MLPTDTNPPAADALLSSGHPSGAARDQVFGQALRARLHKTLMIWLAVYPAALLVLTLFGDMLRDWPLPLRILASTLIIVPIVANITEPAVKVAADSIARRLRMRSL